MALNKPKELFDGLWFEDIEIEDWAILSAQDQWKLHLNDLSLELESISLEHQDQENFWPILREALNSIVLGRSKTNSTKQWAFLRALADVLPCEECSKHLKEFMRMNPVDASTQLRYAQYILRIHNQVNLRNWKDEWTITDYITYLYNSYKNDDSWETSKTIQQDE